MGSTIGHSESPDPRVLKTLSIAEHYPSMSTDEAARRVQLSPSRLRHLFRADIGAPLAAELRFLRLVRAAELLVQSDETIKSVAYRAGYMHVTSFTRAFRKEFGVTPAAYRVNPS